MGRARKIYVGDREYKPKQYQQDYQLRFIDTEPELRQTLKEDGVVSEQLRQRGLAFENWTTGQAEVNEKGIKDEVKALRSSIVDARTYSRSYTEQLAGESQRGLKKRQELNAINRDYRTRALAVELAARAGKIKLSSSDRETLTVIKKGFLQAVWGANNEHAQGKVSKKATWSGGSYKDASAKARAAENSERLAEYRGKIQRQSSKPSVNPFSKNYQRPAVSNPRGTAYPPEPRREIDVVF